MLAVQRSGLATVAAVGDTAAEAAEAAASEAGAPVVDVDRLLDGSLGLDGVVIATPSALHAEQAITALDAGLAVFCQKPLGRTAEECGLVVAAARAGDRLLGVDLSYRHVRAVEAMRDVVASGGVGDVFAVDLVFHNAYGPDKAWFADPALAGGGCVIDLGIHLVDLALRMLGGPKVERVEARLFAGGRPLPPDPDVVEDHAVARLDLASGTVVNLACSWYLHAGCDAVISAAFHGTSGGVALRNVGGSFYDFRADLHRGTSTEPLAAPPDDWGGRAAVAWAARLAAAPAFDPAVEDIVAVAEVLDRIYGR
jgi:predicted dehydrogenase